MSAAIVSTTGYSTTDFDLWPGLSKGILFILMFIGACAGSTAGGLKVSRIVPLYKRVSSKLKQMIHPRSTQAVRFEGKSVENETLNGVLVYFTIYFFCFAAILLLLLFESNIDFETNVSAVAACFNNVGPGLAKVGPSGNYDFYNSFSKAVLSIAMLFGRLEIYPLILLFSRGIWTK
jgi:trk system potassium uptake protein TrkH